ncbi:hypothetical protein ElyMa_001454700 [Elysia marginata]|uniref:Uncharacterized protein n=1 Tax=Elysia marginata TaxID=1093978 RepID=A0AAV4IYR6_9GAST|nr:hypothetical protein ElyMa_001454700 [Elysia marginata]
MDCQPSLSIAVFAAAFTHMLVISAMFKTRMRTIVEYPTFVNDVYDNDDDDDDDYDVDNDDDDDDDNDDDDDDDDENDDDDDDDNDDDDDDDDDDVHDCNVS